jgi:hypothetical protein
MARAKFGIKVSEYDVSGVMREVRWLTAQDKFTTLAGALKAVRFMAAEYTVSEFGVYRDDVTHVELSVVKGKRGAVCYRRIVDLA